MGEYSKDRDINKRIIQGLRIDIQSAPLELQLLWLFELLMLKSFLNVGLDSKLVSINPRTGMYRFQERSCIQGFDLKYAKPINLLQKYRDKFVHSGASAAIVALDNILMHKDSIIEVASIVNVSLNFDNKLF